MFVCGVLKNFWNRLKYKNTFKQGILQRRLNVTTFLNENLVKYLMDLNSKK